MQFPAPFRISHTNFTINYNFGQTCLQIVLQSANQNLLNEILADKTLQQPVLAVVVIHLHIVDFTFLEFVYFWNEKFSKQFGCTPADCSAIYFVIGDIIDI